MKISEYTMPEVRYFMAEANFTNEEMVAFMLLANGATIEYTAEKMDFSVSTIKRIKRQIKAKIDRLTSL